MNYKINPEITKIVSPVTLILPNGNKKEFSSGAEAVDTSFDHRYLVSTIRAVDNVVELRLVEQEVPLMNWSGEEPTEYID